MRTHYRETIGRAEFMRARHGHGEGVRCAQHSDSMSTLAVDMRVPRLRYVAEELDVTCWCDTTIVRVSTADVRNGKTKSCGTRLCDEIAAEAAEQETTS